MTKGLTNDQLDELRKGQGSFGSAIAAAKEGYKVARIGWNGSGMFAYIVPRSDCEMYDTEKEIFGEKDTFFVREHWRLKTAQDDIAMWSPSGSDSLAEDWCIVE
jgi:hypothetical protein